VYSATPILVGRIQAKELVESSQFEAARSHSGDVRTSIYRRKHQLDSTEVGQLIVEFASDKLAEDIVMLDLRRVASFADYFVIMSADSSRQIEALEEDLTKALKESNVPRHRREGTAASGWVLVDFSDVIVHIFSPEEREFYDLERLWSGASQVVRVL
jgi:ribosome-associated protein